VQVSSLASRLYLRKSRGKQVGKHRNVRRSQGAVFAALMTVEMQAENFQS